jgi:hypothetical protein
MLFFMIGICAVKNSFSRIFKQIFLLMKRLLSVFFLCSISNQLFAQNEIGPDGDKLIWLLLIVLIIVIIIFQSVRIKNSKNTFSIQSLFAFRRLKIELKKDRIYYPDYLTLNIKNAGNTAIDLDKPMLVFDNFWLKRNFRIKGMNNRTFYPLYLEKGKTHSLEIDLNQFYKHDKRLKKYPKLSIKLFDVKNRKLGSSSIYVRKTLLKF